jgi:hypothetical protein
MNKPSKISYKTYFNEKLKQVPLGKIMTHPLYVQVTFERKTLFFKSNFFELFSKPKYIIAVAGLIGSPSLEKIITLEMEVIQFIENKHSDNFSLELFKQDYAFYSQDLCDIMEEDFRNYLYTFFQDKSMPVFAVAIREGSRERITYEIIKDLKKAFTKSFYDELIENSLYYGPPYFSLYDFMLQTKKWPMLYLSVMEWETGNTKTEFVEYLKKHYPKHNADEIKNDVEKWVGYIKNKTI